MSIINEALKKAEKSTSTQSPSTETTPKVGPSSLRGVSPASPFLEHSGRKRSLNWGPVFVLSVLLLIAGPITIPMILNNPSKKIVEAGEAGLTVLKPSLPVSGQFAVEEAPLAQTPATLLKRSAALSAPKFNLNGVVYSQAESYCLINGKVVKVGESVGGAVVESVSPTSVTLRYGGKPIVLLVEN